MRRRRVLAVALATLAALGAGCTVGPDYTRPEVRLPPKYRADPAPAPDPASVADLRWFQLFQDDALQELVRTALAQNYDLQAAAARILRARAQLGIARADRYPTVDGTGQLVRARTAPSGATPVPPGTDPESGFGQLGLSLSWELDLWGRIRRLTESAVNQLLAAEDVRRGVVVTLVGAVASGYFTLRELDEELAIARRTLETRERGLRITTARRDRGVASGLDVRQAEDLVYTAAAASVRIERLIEQQENQLSLLLAQDPAPIRRGRALTDQPLPPIVPAGVPSALLIRRPDVRAAERNLAAANAQIGAATALLFPQITITGLLGLESRALDQFFSTNGLFWQAAAGAIVPIFNAGRIRSGVDFAEARTQEALVQYESTVRTAVREVSDALIGYRKVREERGQQERLVGARQATRRLSLLRYQGGLDSYLQVLDADSRLFDGELQLAQLQRDELLAVVQLYRALGGGWES